MSRLSLNYYMTKHRFAGWVERNICHKYMRFAAFIGNCKAITKQLKEEGCPEHKIKLLYNGIETDRFTIKPKKSQNQTFSSSYPLKIVTVGNLHEYKGYDDLLEALALLIKSDRDLPPWLCEIAGVDVDGSLLKLKQKADTLGLTNSVRFLGYVHNIAEFLNSAHLFIHPSHTEGLPNAVIEAMASGLPVIATKVGGITELIEDGINGLLIEPSSPRELKLAINKYLKDMVYAQKMGEVSSRLAKEKFDVKTSVLKYQKIYTDLLK